MNICCRDDIRIICILVEIVSTGGAEVSCGDDTGCRSNGRALDNAGLYLLQCRCLTMVLGAVRVAVEILDQLVIYMVWDMHLGVFIEHC